LPAKIAALAVFDILKDGAAGARKVKSERPAKFTRREYVDFLNSILAGDAPRSR